MSSISIMGRYAEIFPDDKSKAEAFDKIAERFYQKNFGTLSKTDMETLMFSIYIEQILAKGDKDFSTYSDYTLAKELGITQSKVSNLKVKKQLQYPHEYDWRVSFASISDRARYENGKIIIQIPDINLYYEIKNAIEDKGGFVEVTLNRGLLVVPLNYFLNFMEFITEGEDQDRLRKAIRKEYQKYQKEQEIIEKEPIGKVLQKCGASTIIGIIDGVANSISDPASVGLNCALAIAKNVLDVIKNA